MELNAEQIKKALEHCIKDSTCEQCQLSPFTCHIQENALSLINSQEQRIGAQDMTISDLRQRAEKAEHDADRYAQRIKELTEENERLRNKVTATIILTDKDAEKIKNECLERIELDVKAIQAETVRKMQNLIAQKIGTYTKESYVYVHAWFKLIDQIAKEMLEEVK